MCRAACRPGSALRSRQPTRCTNFAARRFCREIRCLAVTSQTHTVTTRFLPPRSFPGAKAAPFGSGLRPGNVNTAALHDLWLFYEEGVTNHHHTRKVARPFA